MGKTGTGTKHHCVGRNGWVGDISPGGCKEVTRTNMVTGRRVTYCSKHEMPCRRGCATWNHLKNEAGCKSCLGLWNAEARRAKEAVEEAKNAARGKVDDAFWNPAKERKKPRKQ